MSYVDAIHDRKKDKILVAERVNGERVLTEFDADYVFYYDHPQGTYRSIFGDSLKKFETQQGQKFNKELKRITAPLSSKRAPRIWESDINPVFRSLAKHYSGVEAPTLNIGFFDIEVDFNPDVGYAPVTDPFNAVTAISVYLTSTSKLYTLALLPPTYSVEEGSRICGKFEDTFLFTDEGELLKAFFEIIEDVDVLSGWNSTGFDIPYLVNRITRVLGKDATRAFCLWNQLPREREYLQFKRTHKTYDLVGRVHLDYLELYRKHNTQQLHSYRLDYVGEIETGENKVQFEGTLDDLYKKEFEKFIEYNRQDTLLLYKIDAKRKFIELSNQVAHGNCVLLKTTLGSVSLVETAIINEMHKLGFIAPDRKPKPEGDSRAKQRVVEDDYDDDDDDDEDRGFDVEEDGRTPVVGAYVAKPKKGLHDEIGCVDINSLYPSTIRALNMSPETIVGQLRLDETMALITERVKKLGKNKRAEAWDGIFACLEFDHMHAKDGAPITVDFEDGTSRVFSGRQLYDFVYNPANNLCITANGTLFRTERDGIIPQLLATWYSQRKEMQGKEKAFGDRAKGKELEAFCIPILQEAGIPIEGELTKDELAQCKYLEGFWNQRQQARKILLNSLYGALLNEGLRFYDERLGQSVTLTGRSIVRHMNSKINEIITGEYKIDGDAIIYSDTDSSYFTAISILKQMDDYGKEGGWGRSETIKLYDDIAAACNATFPEFMHKTFNTTLERGGIIAAGRELVASKGLFIKKKKYAVLMYDKEGTRLDFDKQGNPAPGKLKAMGLDLKRADTPKFMQKFLEKVLMDLLTGSEKEEIFAAIRQFRVDFKARPAWEKGTPKKVSALADYTARKKRSANMTLMEATKIKKGEKVRVNKVAHYESAMNWNHLCESNGDRYSMRIGDGGKIVVCKLRHNLLGMSEVAYPFDEPHLPKWFRELPFDHDLMETTIIDKKLNNLLGVLEWDFNDSKVRRGDEFFVFE